MFEKQRSYKIDDRADYFEQFMKKAIDNPEWFRELTLKEAAEFGVEDLNPFGPRYQWGSPAANEAAVRCIEETYPVTEGPVICYGPSNIMMWYSLEKDMLPYRAQNHGIGGCIDEEMMEYAPRLLYAYRPKAVIFQTGSNDIASGIPLTEILENKKKMYGMFLKDMPYAQLIVCSGLPLPGRMQFWDATVETNKLLEKYCAETERMHFLDATDSMLTDTGDAEFRTADGRYFNPAYFRMDRIHLNKKGHDVWTSLMKKMLDKIFSGE
ncbi:MAG: hypothetical protein IJH99_03855 [Eubacterium sp.]|nr:hypothetical protein [Eubacterium sp.]